MANSIFSDAAKKNSSFGSDTRIDSFKERVAFFQTLAEEAGAADAVIVTHKGDTATSINSASLDLRKLDKEKLKKLNIDLSKLEVMAGEDKILTSREVLDRYGDFQEKFNKSGLKFTDITLSSILPQSSVTIQTAKLTNSVPQKIIADVPSKPVSERPRLASVKEATTPQVAQTSTINYKDLQKMAKDCGLTLVNKPGDKIDPSRFVMTTYDIAAARDRGIFSKDAQSKTPDGAAPISVIVTNGSYAKVEKFMNAFRTAYLPKDADGNPDRFDTIAVNSHGGTDGWLGDAYGRVKWNLFPSIQDDAGDNASGLLKQSKHLYLAGCEVLSQIDAQDYKTIQTALKNSDTVLTANTTYSEMKDKATNDGGGNAFTLDGTNVIRNPGNGDKKTDGTTEYNGKTYFLIPGGPSGTLYQKWKDGKFQTQAVR